MEIKPLNLFYEEPDPDRWFKFDRYPRKLIRRIVRGKQRLGGQRMIAINLMKGLDKLGVPYRLNDYKYIKKHPGEIACIIGKIHVLFEKNWENPVLFGAGIYSHSIECPDLFERYPNVKKVLVPGDWMRRMFEPDYGDKVIAWPVGIDTDYWKPIYRHHEFDFLIYNKALWNKEQQHKELVAPIINILNKRKLTYHIINYGDYTHAQLLENVGTSKAVIFLGRHETQGIAYQQILATNTPILAWDKGGYWEDPYYYPHKVQFKPVSSVPYWDETCGEKFTSPDDFETALNLLNKKMAEGFFSPRKYIVNNLSLEICAKQYLDIWQQIKNEL
ncbi:MAG: glycosyltransferase family 1 protein [Bacteroidota bacterium]